MQPVGCCIPTHLLGQKKTLMVFFWKSFLPNQFAGRFFDSLKALEHCSNAFPFYSTATSLGFSTPGVWESSSISWVRVPGIPQVSSVRVTLAFP